MRRISPESPSNDIINEVVTSQINRESWVNHIVKTFGAGAVFIGILLALDGMFATQQAVADASTARGVAAMGIGAVTLFAVNKFHNRRENPQTTS